MINCLRKHSLDVLSSLSSKRSLPYNLFGLVGGNRYSFGEWDRQAFIKKIGSQIQSCKNGMVQRSNQNQQYFKKAGWVFNHSPGKAFLQYSKVSDQYEVRIFSQIKANPPNLADQTFQFFEKSKEGQKQFNFAEVTVWLRKKEEPRWLVTEMIVLDGSVDLNTLYFSQSEPHVGLEYGIYNGPDMNSLPNEILKAINSLLQNVGIDTETVMNMVINASECADKEDLGWLENLKEMLQ